jgi:hypothetical protein
MCCPEPSLIERGVIIAFALTVAGCASPQPVTPAVEPAPGATEANLIPEPHSDFSDAPTSSVGLPKSLCCEARDVHIVRVAGTVSCRTATGIVHPLTEFAIRSSRQAGDSIEGMAEHVYQGSEGKFSFSAVLLTCQGETRDEPGSPIPCTAVIGPSFVVRSRGCRDTKFVVGDETDEFTITMECPEGCSDD